MKKLALSFGILLLGVFAINPEARAQAVAPTPEISFDKDVHDYGNIKINANGESEFKFTNTGTAPLVISEARGSCGCTVPEWPKTPIKPGESAVIKVKYDTKHTGPINRTVTIISNAGESPTKTLRIKGNVEAPENGGAPVKTDSPGAPVERR